MESTFLLPAFPCTQNSIAGKNVGFNSLTFVLIETSKHFMIIVKFAIASFLKLILFFDFLLV